MCVFDLVKLSRKLDASHGGTVGGLSSCANYVVTSVYGPTNNADKATFLSELIASQPISSMPWVCLGDFNFIYEAQDKNNNNLNRMQMRRFRQASSAYNVQFEGQLAWFSQLLTAGNKTSHSHGF